MSDNCGTLFAHLKVVKSKRSAREAESVLLIPLFVSRANPVRVECAHKAWSIVGTRFEKGVQVMSQSKHDKVAGKIAQQQGTQYNRGQGADVNSPKRAVEVETTRTIGDAARQLTGYQKPVYVAGADAEATKKALEHYKGTTIGVMNQSGKILKRSTRGRRG